MDFLPACKLSDLPEGGRRIVTVGGRELALFRVGGELFAIDNACPHRGGPLGEGDLAGYLLHCPLHAWAFDLRSGQSTSHPGAQVTRYAVRCVGDEVQTSSRGTRSPSPE